MATIAMGGVTGKKPQRSLWWRVHQWAGLQVSLFLAFILATGTLATLSHEIDWLLTPAMQVAPREGPQASWGALGSAARAAAGNARIERVSAPRDPWFAAEALAVRPGGERFRIQIDPWTAQVQGVSPWFNAQRLFRELHRHLMLPTRWGIPIVTALAIPMLASVITGLFVYKKWWRGFFRVPHRRPDRRNDGRRFTGDLHRFVGLWLLWFVALIGVTGLWYLIEWGGGNAPVERPAAVLPQAQAEGRALDRMVALARQQYPQLRVTSIYFPEKKPGGVIVMGDAEALLVRERANAVMVDPEKPAAVERLRGIDLTLHQRISEAADPLHFGTWGGLATRILWFLFGAGLTGLAVTGVLIYALRLKHDAAGQRKGGILAAAWRGMGVMAWPSLALIIIALALIPANLAGD
ncbi:MAG TPA: PepSY-associated TM helix domain-containing protein [Sphingomonadaceae bacterium]|nr:PepSY-associated TM helix domain-containing protein [Sphingomonadaceae bacterium]